MDTEQRFVFDKLDFCRIAGEQRELNGRKSWPDDPEGGLVLRIVDDCFDYELKLLPRIVSDSITPPAPRPVLPRTRASPPGDWYRGPSAFLRWSGSTILTSKTPGTDWHPKQSAGGMQFLCVAHTLVIIAPETGYRLTVLPRFRRRHFIWEMGDGRSRLRLTRCTCASAWVLLWA